MGHTALTSIKSYTISISILVKQQSQIFMLQPLLECLD